LNDNVFQRNTALSRFKERVVNEHTMEKIEIYGRPGCAYCSMVKRLFDSKQVAYRYYDVYVEPSRMQELRCRTNGRTFPQVFINEISMGGFEEILTLDRQQRLPI
jgi:glutaredoxin 3